MHIYYDTTAVKNRSTPRNRITSGVGRHDDYAIDRMTLREMITRLCTEPDTTAPTLTIHRRKTRHTPDNIRDEKKTSTSLATSWTAK